jgi:hypothetical protein
LQTKKRKKSRPISDHNLLMSLNNIQLNAWHLAELFRNCLVETDEVSQNKEKIFTNSPAETIRMKEIDPPIREWKWLGENKKNILLVVRYANTAYLPDEQLNFLTSILGACKLSLIDVAILNIANAPADSYKSISDQFKSRITVLFGITPTEFAMPANFPEFQVQVLNSCTFLHTPMLEKLEADKVLKSKLWVCLRKMFSLF